MIFNVLKLEKALIFYGRVIKASLGFINKKNHSGCCNNPTQDDIVRFGPHGPIRFCFWARPT